MRLASEPRNQRLPKLVARSKKVRNTALICLWTGQCVCACHRLGELQIDLYWMSKNCQNRTFTNHMSAGCVFWKTNKTANLNSKLYKKNRQNCNTVLETRKTCQTVLTVVTVGTKTTTDLTDTACLDSGLRLQTSMSVILRNLHSVKYSQQRNM